MESGRRLLPLLGESQTTPRYPPDCCSINGRFFALTPLHRPNVVTFNSLATIIVRAVQAGDITDPGAAASQGQQVQHVNELTVIDVLGR